MPTLSRSQAATEIAGRLRGWLGLARMLGTDTPSQLGGVLDQVFRQLGVLEDDIATATITSATMPAYLALSTYFALIAVKDAVGPLVDLQASATGVTKARSQAMPQLDQRIAEAFTNASPYFTVSFNWGTGYINLDITEPIDPSSIAANGDVLYDENIYGGVL